MKNQIVGFTIGIMLLIVGATGLIPAYVDFLAGHPNYVAFLECSVLSLIFGGTLILINKPQDPRVSIRQSFILTSLSWFFLGIFSSLPLYFSDLDISFIDAFFESVSGITTTGSTILTGLDDMSHGILLWRSIIQWIGGIGIIAFAIIILPFLNIGGMQLFKTESSDKSEKFIPKTQVLVRSLLLVYCLLTLACMITYFVLGMTFFDALNHALTTIPTGGYSTHDASFGYFESPALHYAGSFFMLCGSIPFVLYVKFMVQGKFEIFKDEQVKTLLYMLALIIGTLSIWVASNTELPFTKALMLTTFNVISVISTTGYASSDYLQWGSFPIMVFFMITYLGACTGSTSGGIKTMRLIIAYRVVRRQLNMLIYPHGVFSVHYQDKSVNADVISAVMIFLGIYFITNILLTGLLTICGLDFETAISGAATALANVGPGIGGTIGPAGNFSSLPDTAKLILAFGMLIGRLEIMTVLILFNRDIWRT